MENKYNIKPEGAFPIQADGHLPSGEWYYCRARHFGLEVVISPKDDDFWCQENGAVHKFLDFAPDGDGYSEAMKMNGKELWDMAMKIADGNIPENNPLIPQYIDAKVKYNFITKDVHKYITDPKYKDWAYEGGNIGCWDGEEDLFINICQNIIDEYYNSK